MTLGVIFSYSKAPIIRTEHWAVLAVHSVYCRTGISTGTYNRNFRVSRGVIEDVLFFFNKEKGSVNIDTILRL